MILGTAGNCIDILDTINDINAARGSQVYECGGFLDDDVTMHGKTVQGLPVLGPLSRASECVDYVFVNGIGSPSNFWKKRNIIAKTGVPLERFETVVHPTASVSRMAQLGHGVVVFQHVTITSNVTVGHHVIILPNTVVSHDNIVGDYTCIAGGVCISGNVSVGHSCYLGANATIIHGARIGDHCLIGMGSVVLTDVPNNSVMVGNPARFLRKTIDER